MSEYRVLARKYRPSTFDDLIGQDVLVRTLSNAIEAGRLAHAFLLTGIRGIGKTTTARIIARALNCIGEDGQGGPTIHPCGVCANCTMIAEDRHVDVLEMDAASRTGVGDIRDLIDTVQYAPTHARYKIYIIDEVHMLSNSAFNALLKTLEEPPPHVKFIFATTESRKIPVTILSRCQRFDLKRIGLEELANHIDSVSGKEGIAIEGGAAKLISQAAEGSARDALSLLDQIIAQHRETDTPIGEAEVRHMLGLSDRGQTLSLLTFLFKGEIGAALPLFRRLYVSGADPQLLLQDMLELTHFITRIKLVPEVGNDLSYSETERTRASELAKQLSLPSLSRMWQLLLKGVGEVRLAPSPVAAAEMVLVRSAYLSQQPSPDELIRKIQMEGVTAPAPSAKAPAPAQAVETASAPAEVSSTTVVAEKQAQEFAHDPMPQDFQAMVDLLQKHMEPLLASQLQEYGAVVHYEPGKLEVNMQAKVANDFTSRIASALKKATGKEWAVSLTDKSGGPTLSQQFAKEKADKIERASGDPLVSSVLEHFPGAKIEEVA